MWDVKTWVNGCLSSRIGSYSITDHKVRWYKDHERTNTGVNEIQKRAMKEDLLKMIRFSVDYGEQSIHCEGERWVWSQIMVYLIFDWRNDDFVLRIALKDFLFQIWFWVLLLDVPKKNHRTTVLTYHGPRYESVTTKQCNLYQSILESPSDCKMDNVEPSNQWTKRL